jgi:hypothetical protein
MPYCRFILPLNRVAGCGFRAHLHLIAANAFSQSKYDRTFDIAPSATLPVTLPARTQQYPTKAKVEEEVTN